MTERITVATADGRERTFTRHPASAVWPPLSEDEFAALKASIAEHGLSDPLKVVAGDKLIDGWQRLRACVDTGTAPAVTDLGALEPGQIASLIAGLHAGRRHLGKQRIAALIVETKLACGMSPAPRGGDRRSEQFSNRQTGGLNDSGGTFTAADIAGEAGNISERTAERAIDAVQRRHGLKPDPLPDPDGIPDPFAPHSDGGGKTLSAEDAADFASPDLAAELDRLQTELAQVRDLLEAEREERAEERAIFESGLSEDERQRAETLNNLTAENRTLRSQVNEWQAKHSEAMRTIRGLRRKLAGKPAQ